MSGSPPTASLERQVPHGHPARPGRAGGTDDAAREDQLRTRQTAAQSSQYQYARADLAVDGFTMGNLNLGSVATALPDPQPWWQVDLGATTRIGVIKVFNRTDCCADRLHDWTVWVLERTTRWCGRRRRLTRPRMVTSINAGGVNGRYVKVQLNHSDYLQLAEVQVFGKN